MRRITPLFFHALLSISCDNLTVIYWFDPHLNEPKAAASRWNSLDLLESESGSRPNTCSRNQEGLVRSLVSSAVKSDGVFVLQNDLVIDKCYDALQI